MTDKLPPNLLKLFAPRPPLPHTEPLDRPFEKRKGYHYQGLGDVVNLLADYDKDYVPWETLEERRLRKVTERKAKNDDWIAKQAENWKPHEIPDATEDPFKTLFVGRISYETTEKTLRREFEVYGPIKTIRMIYDKMTGKPRGYAFIEFENEADMKAAYKDADGMKIDGRRIMLDVERGRTVKGWKPRRLGGGLGHTRLGPSHLNQRYSGRDISALKAAGPANDAGTNVIGESEEYPGSYGGRPRGRGGFGGRGGRSFRDRDRDRSRDRDRDRRDRSPRRDRRR